MAREQEEQLRLERRARAAVVEAAAGTGSSPSPRAPCRPPAARRAGRPRSSCRRRSGPRPRSAGTPSARSPRRGRSTREASGQRASSSPDVSPSSGCTKLGRDLGERREHEAPLGQPRVGDHEPGPLDSQLAVEQHVDVDRARPVAQRAHAAELALGVEAGARAAPRARAPSRPPRRRSGTSPAAGRRPARSASWSCAAGSRTRARRAAGAPRDRRLAIAQVRAEPEEHRRVHGPSIIHAAPVLAAVPRRQGVSSRRSAVSPRRSGGARAGAGAAGDRAWPSRPSATSSIAPSSTRKAEHLKYRKDGTWRAISSDELRSGGRGDLGRAARARRREGRPCRDPLGEPARVGLRRPRDARAPARSTRRSTRR